MCLTEASFCEEQVAVERLNLLLFSRTILEVKKIQKLKLISLILCYFFVRRVKLYYEINLLKKF